MQADEGVEDEQRGAQRGDGLGEACLVISGVDVREAALGPDHREIPYGLLALSQVLRGLGRLDEALVHARRAVAVAERTVGPDDFMLAPPLEELGLVEAMLGQFAEADDHLRRALAIADKVLPAGNAERMSMAAALGDSLTLQSRWHDAARRYEAAIPALHSQPGNPERLAFATANLARIYVELADRRVPCRRSSSSQASSTRSHRRCGR